MKVSPYKKHSRVLFFLPFFLFGGVLCSQNSENGYNSVPEKYVSQIKYEEEFLNNFRSMCACEFYDVFPDAPRYVNTGDRRVDTYNFKIAGDKWASQNPAYSEFLNTKCNTSKR
jgi:hypothetical protein